MAQAGWRGLAEFLWRVLGVQIGVAPTVTITGESLISLTVSGDSLLQMGISGESLIGLTIEGESLI